MKKHSYISILLAKVFFSLVRVTFALRYKVTTKGTELLKSKNPKFILPNHQAIVDPIGLFCHIYKYSTAVPVIISSYYDLPIAKFFFSNWGAVRVSDLEAGSKNTNVLNQITESIDKGFALNKNIVLYPSGQLPNQGFERILNKQSAWRVAEQLPDNVEIIGVRIKGFWGSIWSKAWTGESPNFTKTLLKSFFYLFANLIFFLPRRKVNIEFHSITQEAKEKAKDGKLAFNSYLEGFYNAKGEEKTYFLKHYFYGKKIKKKVSKHNPNPTQTHKSFNDHTFKVVSEITSKILNLSQDSIKPSNHLQLELGTDSLNLVEIISEIEKHFPSFKAPQINDLKTIADLCLAAEGKLAADEELKPCNLHQPLSHQTLIKVDDEKTITEAFIHTFSTNKKDPFVFDNMIGSTTRGEFFLKANVVAEFLKSTVKENRVGIMLPALQSATLLVAACYLAKKTPVMLNWTVGAKVLEHCIESSEVNVVLSAGSFIKKIEDLLNDQITSKIVHLDKIIPQIQLSTKLKGLIKSKFPSLFYKKAKPDDVAVILFTSGSEALPKAVPLTHQNIVSDLSGVLNMIDLDNNNVLLSFLPPFHSFGFTVLSILPIITGVKTGYTPNPTDAKEVIRILKHIKANILIGTPSFLKILMNEANPDYLRSIKYAISGAEAMSPAVKKQFESLVPDGIILEGYGITECAPVLSLNPLEKQKLNSVGKLLPGIKWKILHPETNQPMSINEPGMIYVKGKNIFSGYLNNSVANPFINLDGESYYKTGDLGYIDEDGYLFITGRLKRFIKIGGEMISLPFIEKQLLEKFGHPDSQVLAIEGSDKTTHPEIVLFSCIDLELNEVNNYLLKNGNAAIAKISRIEQIDEIPLLGSGKVDYKILKAQIEQKIN